MNTREQFISRMEDIEVMMISQDYDGLDNYGLELKYKPEEEEFHWMLSWGGPQETIIMRGFGKHARFFFEYKHWNEYDEFEVTSPLECVALRTLFMDWFNVTEMYDVLQ